MVLAVPDVRGALLHGLVFRHQSENVIVNENATGYRYAGPYRLRTEVWRSLSYHLGDTLADAFCDWCDAQPEPAQAAAALESIMALMANVDEDEDHKPKHLRIGAVRLALLQYAGSEFAREQGYVLPSHNYPSTWVRA